MSAQRKTITVSHQQDLWIKAQVESGDYNNDSEYIRELVRKDQMQNLKLVELKNAIDEGFNSGTSDLKIADIIKKVDNGEL